MPLSENEKSKALKNLDKAISDVHFDKEEAFELLREADYNPDNITKKHVGRIKKLQVQLEIERSKAKRSNFDLLQLALQQLEKFRGKFHKEPKDLLQQFYKGKVALQFRKLEEISEADAIELLEEAQLLKLIKELEKRNNE